MNTLYANFLDKSAYWIRKISLGKFHLAKLLGGGAGGGGHVPPVPPVPTSMLNMAKYARPSKRRSDIYSDWCPARPWSNLSSSVRCTASICTTTYGQLPDYCWLHTPDWCTFISRGNFKFFITTCNAVFILFFFIIFEKRKWDIAQKNELNIATARVVIMPWRG